MFISAESYKRTVGNSWSQFVHGAYSLVNDEVIHFLELQAEQNRRDNSYPGFWLHGRYKERDVEKDVNTSHSHLRCCLANKTRSPETQSPELLGLDFLPKEPHLHSPSSVEVALSSPSTYCTLTDVTRNVLEAVVDAIVHNIHHKLMQSKRSSDNVGHIRVLFRGFCC